MTEQPCKHCGQTEGHPWVEGDCVLPHRAHSRKLVEGAHVCVPCVDRHRAWLREITDLYATLGTVVLAGSLPDESTGEYQKKRKAPASPSPLRLAAWAMLYGRLNSHVLVNGAMTQVGAEDGALPDVPAVLANWAEALYDALEWTATAPTTVTGAVAVLTGHAEDMARLPDIDTYDAELRWIRNALRSAHGVTDRQPVGRCPSLDGWGRECGGPLWADTEGRMAVKCSRCGKSFGEQYLKHLGRMMSA